MSGDAPTLKQLGWDQAWEKAFAPFDEKGWYPGRIAVEGKGQYVVLSEQGEMTGIVAGKLLHTSYSAADLPKVGDWVALTYMPDEDKAVINAVAPRRTKISRKTAGREIEEQILVTNVDLAFVVHAMDRTFNARLLERHIMTVLEGGSKPIVVLNKEDLCEDIPATVAAAERSAAGVEVVVVSALTGGHINELARHIHPGETVVFIGSSGVGKSSLINRLYGEEVQHTIEVRESDSKGRHTTTAREMIVLPNGALVIDTPGTREFHVWFAGEGMVGAFPEVEELAIRCHFRNCSHTVEKRCAVLGAVADGSLPAGRYQGYLKLQRELKHLELSQSTRATVDRKNRDKVIHKALKKLHRIKEKW